MNLQRLADIAEQYQSGKVLREIGRDYGISRERVRQLIVVFERQSGQPIARHYGADRTVRQCADCGISICRIKSSTRCRKCSGIARRGLRTSQALCEAYFDRRKAGESWRGIARSSGYKSSHISHAIILLVAKWLSQEGRLDELRPYVRKTAWLRRHRIELQA